MDAIAATAKDGTLWLEVTNVDPNQPIDVELSVAGVMAKSVTAETLTAPKVDSVNSFDAPNQVVSKPISAKAQGGNITLKLEPKSVTVVQVKQ